VNRSLYFDIIIIPSFVRLPWVELRFNLGHGLSP
jgi:hypothetical protein